MIKADFNSEKLQQSPGFKMHGVRGHTFSLKRLENHHYVTGMPLSNAEKQRRYRARRDSDPERRQGYLAKERQVWAKKKEKEFLCL